METDNLKQVDFQIAGIAIEMKKKKKKNFWEKAIILAIKL